MAHAKVAKRLILREIAELERDPLECFFVKAADGDDVFHWQATLMGPKDSPYAGGVFVLDILYPPTYPFNAPKIISKTRIYNCNISSDRIICLECQHSPACALLQLLLHIYSWLLDPDADDPLVPEIAEVYKTDRAQHDATAREWTERYATGVDGQVDHYILK